MSKLIGAELLVACLEKQGVEYVFGIPGAKVDAVFNALVGSTIKLIVCRHEQNATFMAAAYGRITGKPGVVLVTSGPGVANLTTGLLTATTEGDPVVAIGANVPRRMHLKDSHQSADNANLHKANTKSSVEIADVSNIPEVLENAFRLAVRPRGGACFISVPQDLLLEKTTLVAKEKINSAHYGAANSQALQAAADLINRAKLPVLLAGEEASRPENAAAIRAFLQKNKMGTIGTFQSAGVLSRDLVSCFVGRVGLFKNQPGDQLLEKADVVLTVGFNPVEYDPDVWNAKGDKTIINIDYNPAVIQNSYRPTQGLIGNVSDTLLALKDLVHVEKNSTTEKFVASLHDTLIKTIESGANKSGKLIHPLRFIYELQNAITDETRVICDVGSVYMWMARYFLCYVPRNLLFSNGQQTLGVGLPWAMGSCFACPTQNVVSVSGDGGFLFSAMELETAVREKCNFVHFIWSDHRYDMVYEQELTKYKRGSGVDLGPIDVVKFAESFGAHGFLLDNADDFQSMIKEAQSIHGPVLIDVPIDYSDNPELFALTRKDVGN